MNRIALTLAANLLLTSQLLAADDCRFTAERAAELPVDGIARLIVRAGAGSLEVVGDSGIRSVRAHGTACASSEALLEQVQIRLERRGDDLVLRAMPREASVDPRAWFGGSHRLDLTVALPAGLAVDIEDGSGDARIANVGAAHIVDAAGSLEIEHVRGGVNVRDGSGQLTIRDIDGPVRIEDGSGDIVVSKITGDVIVANDGSGAIDMEEIKGNVTIGSDGSGDISIAHVTGSVRIENDGSGGIFVRFVQHDVSIEEDGSGDIVVENVQGDLTIGEPGSGDVEHRDVRGRVSIAGGNRL